MRKTEKNLEKLLNDNEQLKLENNFLTTSQKNTSDRYFLKLEIC